MGIETFKSAKDYVLIALMAWGVYEAREIKVDVRKVLIERAGEAVERDQMKKEIKEVQSTVKEHERILTNLEFVLPEKIRLKKNTEEENK